MKKTVIDHDGGIPTGFHTVDIVLYINAVRDESKHYASEIPKGYLTLDCMELTPDQARGKFGLAKKIFDSMQEFHEEHPKPNRDLEEWVRLLNQRFEREGIVHLARKYSEIMGDKVSYIVPPGEYAAGQILNELPENAMRREEVLKD